MNEENSVIVIDQQEQHKKKGALAVILAIAFVAILGIGGTFAYLSYSTNQAMNRFTTVPGDVKADVIEPAWQNKITSGGSYKSSDGKDIPQAATNMGAGSTVAKNPFIVNTTKVGDGTIKGTDEFVAMKLSFQKWVQKEGSTTVGDGEWTDLTADEMATLLAVYNFKSTKNTSGNATNFNVHPDWTKFENADADNADAPNVAYFYYTKALTAMYKPTDGESTVVDEATNATSDTWGYTPGSGPASAELFNNVVYNKDATNNQVTALNTMLTDNYPGWRVVITGAAIQAAEGLQVSTLTKEFKNLLDATATTGASGWRTTANGGTGLVPAAA